MLDSSREISKFNQVASKYNDLLNNSIALSGESAEYFNEYKIACLKQLGLARTISVLDYGCGIGNLTRLLCRECDRVSAFDPSVESMLLARNCSAAASWFDCIHEIPDSSFDMVVLAGVLHHIPPSDRISVLVQVREKVRLGGSVVVFEHNSHNPLTCRAVKACPFDDDAVLLRPSEVRSVISGAGFSEVKQKYIVFFPRLLSWLRPLEPFLGCLPLGAQTLTTGQRVD